MAIAQATRGIIVSQSGRKGGLFFDGFQGGRELSDGRG